MLEFDNVCFQYDVDDYAIMDKLSFQIQDGEFVCVIGPCRMRKEYHIPACEQASYPGCRSCACERPAN